jgi:hypothetical protein
MRQGRREKLGRVQIFLPAGKLFDFAPSINYAILLIGVAGGPPLILPDLI